MGIPPVFSTLGLSNQSCGAALFCEKAQRVVFIGFVEWVTGGNVPWFFVLAVGVIMFMNVRLMQFCPHCSANVYPQGFLSRPKFCPKCGTPIAASGGTAPPPGPTPGYAPPPAAPVQSAGMTDNVAAALCYLVGLITGVLFLVLEPYNKNRTVRLT